MPEATELEGTWEIVSMVESGEQREIEENLARLYRFEGNRGYTRHGDNEDWVPGTTFSLDPSAMLAEIDMDILFGETIRGIYEIDNDVLMICMGIPGESRPDRFESTEDSSTILYEFRRVEEDDE